MIDIGANLTHDRFAKDRQAVIEHAHTSGVQKIIVTGTDITSSLAAIELCEQHPSLMATVGIHPHHASTYNSASNSQLSALLDHPKVVAVGETGLDFNRNFSTKEQQIYAFNKQIELAITHRKPLFLHDREAADTQYPILKEAISNLSGGVIHCFTGTQQSLEKYLELGLYIGITGWICDERRGLDLQKMINIIPDNRLLIETDAPYLTPRTLSSKLRKAKNTPANLGHIAEFIANLRGQSAEQLKAFTTLNAKTLFSI